MTAILDDDPVATWGDAAFDGNCGAAQDRLATVPSSLAVERLLRIWEWAVVTWGLSQRADGIGNVFNQRLEGVMLACGR